MPARLTTQQVLARFDRELGLETVPVAGLGEVAARMPSAPPAHAVAMDAPAGSGASRASAAAARPPVPAPEPAPARASATFAAHVFGAAALAPAGTREERAARLAEIAARHAATCPHCTQARGHTTLVFGEGAPDAQVMFIGEAPGETEDRLGRPFVGPAGEKLDEMIRAMGLARESVYIANVLKARPPENRTPTPEEAARCGPFLVEQVLAVQPAVIVTLGGPATKWICGTEQGISRLRGTWQRWDPPAGANCPSIPVMPTYHPAYVLRTYTKQVRGEVWSDLRQVLARLGRAPVTGAAPAPPT